jgi:hypothetical protein
MLGDRSEDDPEAATFFGARLVHVYAKNSKIEGLAWASTRDGCESRDVEQVELRKTL